MLASGARSIVHRAPVRSRQYTTSMISRFLPFSLGIKAIFRSRRLIEFLDAVERILTALEAGAGRKRVTKNISKGAC